MQPPHLSGLEFLLQLMRGEREPSPMFHTVPMRLTRVEQGHIEMCVRAEQRHTNTNGGVHGGFAATVMDSITGCAVRSMLEAGVTYTTISLELKMLRPPPMEEDMIAVADIVNVSRRLGVATALLQNANGKVLAEGSTTCMIFRD